MKDKQIYRVPFETPYGVTYHDIKAQDKDAIRNNRERLHSAFRGDGLMSLDKNRYALMWFEGSTYEIEI